MSTIERLIAALTLVGPGGTYAVRRARKLAGLCAKSTKPTQNSRAEYISDRVDIRPVRQRVNKPEGFVLGESNVDS